MRSTSPSQALCGKFHHNVRIKIPIEPSGPSEDNRHMNARCRTACKGGAGDR